MPYDDAWSARVSRAFRAKSQESLNVIYQGRFTENSKRSLRLAVEMTARDPARALPHIKSLPSQHSQFSVSCPA